MGITAKIAINAIIGGTAEKLGGGKFANGAVTGAYVMMFNHLNHQEQVPDGPDAWDGFESIDYSEKNDSERAIQILKAWRYSIKNGLDGEIPLDRIFTNLKCGDVLASGGIVINGAEVEFGDKTIKVTIRVDLWNSFKRNDFLGLNVHFGGMDYHNPPDTDWYQLKHNNSILGVEGKENFKSILNWAGYE